MLLLVRRVEETEVDEVVDVEETGEDEEGRSEVGEETGEDEGEGSEDEVDEGRTEASETGEVEEEEGGEGECFSWFLVLWNAWGR